jgi:ornithine cyclodeaminase/alanine dehydrogenase-like protein (mu-crystallin family)
MLVLNKEEIYKALVWGEVLDAIQDGFVSLSTGKASVPLRGHLKLPEQEGLVLTMPGYDGEEGLAVKTVNVFNRNPEKGLPTIFGLVTLFDSNTGQPLAIFDGATLTAIRTGAASGVVTRLLANPDASVLAIFGAGVQAETQFYAIAAARNLKEVRIYDKSPQKAVALATRLTLQTGMLISGVATPQDALQEADIVATATTSTKPVFEDSMVEAGTHINGIGSFTPQMREVPGETVARALLVIDSLEGCLSEAGDVLIPMQEGLIDESHIAAEIGEIAAGKKPGRASREQITFFKSVGNAIQDVALARYLYRKALASSLGTIVNL